MKVIPVGAVVLCAAALAGCSTELGGLGKQSVADATRAPLSAPTSSVESATMPPPDLQAGMPPVTGAGAASASAAVTPRSVASNVPLTAPSIAPTGSAYAATGQKEALSGSWTLAWDSGQHTCPVMLSTDRGMNGLNAQADVSCPSEIFMTKGWDLMGPDIVLQDHLGKVTARLQPAGPNAYTGTLVENNQIIALNR
ncbi:protease inhibitor Inh/omp19 family protein [Xanthobacteraceae bacterium A53D]